MRGKLIGVEVIVRVEKDRESEKKKGLRERYPYQLVQF
jgi:hypothetical protein